MRTIRWALSAAGGGGASAVGAECGCAVVAGTLTAWEGEVPAAGTTWLMVLCLDGGPRNTSAPSGETSGRHRPARQRGGRELRWNRWADLAFGGCLHASADAPVRTGRPAIRGKPAAPLLPGGPSLRASSPGGGSQALHCPRRRMCRRTGQPSRQYPPHPRRLWGCPPCRPRNRIGRGVARN